MTRSSLETTDVDCFDRTIAVNLRAPLLLTQAALPHFRRQGAGRVLNIGSINGYCGERNLLAYSISKAGLMALTRNVADAYGPEGVRVNLLMADGL
jgi:NAD(P)-dependent dehydrogenase (short-subunit alcohol dehydrogenase family)